MIQNNFFASQKKKKIPEQEHPKSWVKRQIYFRLEYCISNNLLPTKWYIITIWKSTRSLVRNNERLQAPYRGQQPDAAPGCLLPSTLLKMELLKSINTGYYGNKHTKGNIQTKRLLPTSNCSQLSFLPVFYCISHFLPCISILCAESDLSAWEEASESGKTSSHSPFVFSTKSCTKKAVNKWFVDEERGGPHRKMLCITELSAHSS